MDQPAMDRPAGADTAVAPQPQQSRKSGKSRGARAPSPFLCLTSQCDGLLPSCKPCQRAGAACTSSSKLRDRDIPKTYIAELKSRVAWLESTVRARCPDVDLEAAPRVSVAPTARSEAAAPRAGDQNDPTLWTAASSFVQGSDEPQGPAAGQDGLASASPDTQFGGLDHELGLVSTSAGTDQRYIGASSGYYFAKLILTTVGRRSPGATSTSTPGNAQEPAGPARHLPSASNILEIAPSPLPRTCDLARQLSLTYFETVHTQFPFLHQTTHEASIARVYQHEATGRDLDPVVLFQVKMVLAIAATILSRRVKVALSAEGLCISALKHLDHIALAGSLRGLQCTLLLLMYALNNPSVGLNMWYIHHQCIASLIDLGLHCDVSSAATPSLVDQQLRRRAFLCVYTLDKTLSTIMGRPAGLRDEDCDCQLPEDVDDGNLSETKLVARGPESPPTPISNALHLFRLARMNSEVKYFLHNRSSHSFSTYTRPPDLDLLAWQQVMLTRLRQWASAIPPIQREGSYIAELSEIKCHTVIMLLLRPSPAVRQPSEASLKTCYESAVQSLRIYNRLYKRNVLAYSWVTVHAVFLGVLTMLYCVWVIPDIAMSVRIDALMSDLKAGSDVLSATGEHWPQAKRCRDALETLSNATIRWLCDVRQRQATGAQQPGTQSCWASTATQAADRPPLDPGQAAPLTNGPVPSHRALAHGEARMSVDVDALSLDPMDYLSVDVFSSFLEPSGDSYGAGDINSIIQGLFSDFQPMIDA